MLIELGVDLGFVVIWQLLLCLFVTSYCAGLYLFDILCLTARCMCALSVSFTYAIK